LAVVEEEASKEGLWGKENEREKTAEREVMGEATIDNSISYRSGLEWLAL